LATFFRGRAVTTEVKHLLWISGGDLDENCPIPKFVLTYIENLPECYLFQGFGSLGQGLLYLCEYGFEHPLDIEALLEQVAAKEDAGLYVAFAEDRRNNLLVRPVPDFQSESSLLQYAPGFSARKYDFVPATELELENLSINIRLVDIEPDFNEPVVALFLEKLEISWLKQLLYHLPAALFEKVEWMGNQDYLFLMFSDTESSAFFPFGQAFKRVTANLMIPADQEILPHLNDQQLDDIFSVDGQHYHFLTHAWHRSVPCSATLRLQQLLAVESAIEVEFRADINPLEFSWEAAGVMSDISPLSETAATTASPHTKLVIPDAVQFEMDLTNGQDISGSPDVIEEKLNEYGTLLNRQGDYLGAATCFSLARESLKAADCYAAAARELE